MIFDLKKFRADHKLNQKEVAMLFKCGQPNISAIEKDGKDLEESQYSALYKIYGEDVVNSYRVQPNTNTPQISYSSGVAYYDIDFIGGFDVILNDQTITPAYLIDFEKYNNADCWCNVTGKSMEPEISHGDIIALKEIPNWQVFLPYGEVYAIVTKDLRTIKKITGSKKEDSFLLIPLNTNPEFQPQEIPKSIITKVYKVLGCMKKI